MKADLPIPEAALRDHMAVLAKTGAGKTSDTKVIVEHITEPGWSGLPEGARVCILDLVKSDWWGLTSSRDGKKPGRPFQILGGPKGHVPLHSNSGKVIGELVARGALRLSILDMADFEPGGAQRFFTDFAAALFKHIKGIVYLVVEEAHELAPKERSGFGHENMAIHWMKKLGTAGRSKGVRMIVCTQRTQALHNAVLGSCETMIAGRFTAPADQDPVLGWFKANVTKERFAEIKSSMSSLKNGEAWVACGEADFLQRVQFPRINTFDNSATPEHGAADVQVRTAPVDRAALAQLIGVAAEEAEANDPKALKAKVAALTAELAKGGGAPAPVQDPGAEQRGYSRGYDTGLDHGLRTGRLALEPVWDGVGDTNSALSNLLTACEAARAAFDAACAMPAPPTIPPKGVERPAGPVPAKRMPAPVLPSEGGTDLTKTQRTILTSMAWWAALGHHRPTRVQVAVKAKMVASGGGFRARMSELSGKGLITYPDKATAEMTPAGVAAAPSPDMDETVVNTIRSILTDTQLRIFNAMLAGHRDRTAIAAACDPPMEASGGGFRARLSELSSLGILEYPSKTTAKLQDWVR